MAVHEIRSSVPSQIQHKPGQNASTGHRRVRERGSSASSSETTAEVMQGSPMTDAEREFFIQLYPGSEARVRSYAFYQKDGGNQPAKLGTLIDRKG